VLKGEDIIDLVLMRVRCVNASVVVSLVIILEVFAFVNGIRIFVLMKK